MLLRPTADASAADVDDGEGAHYERVGVLDRPDPVCLPEVSMALPSLRRDQARRRCTMLLRCLTGVAVSTALIGVLPGMHLAWVVTGISGLATLGLVGLMAYAKELEAEQARRRSRREASRPPRGRRRRDRRLSGRLGRRRHSRCLGPQPADDSWVSPRTAGTSRGSGRPTILATAGGVAQLAERYVRNVEAVGSNPITSTKGPGNGLKVGSPMKQKGFGGFYFDPVEVVTRRKSPSHSSRSQRCGRRSRTGEWLGSFNVLWAVFT